jgi:SAM-dependent methyltransferase
MPPTMPRKPDYGIDAPDVIRNLLLIGLALLAISLFVGKVDKVGPRLRPTMIITASILVAEGLAMLAYSKFGKFRHRDRMLAKINWRGDEQVLDVGTGRGVLLIGAAKHLRAGKAVGIDIWSSKDLSANAMDATYANADLEGVRDRVELKTEDASRMTFADATFDVVVSNLCIHNIEDSRGRESACREIARVLKPGGIAVISDFKNTSAYAHAFSASGLSVERSGLYLFDTFPPLRIITARKPA